MKKFVLPLLLAVFTLSAAGLGYGIHGIAKERKEIENAENASAVFAENSPFSADSTESASDTETSAEELLDAFLPQLRKMQEKNSDIIGWIYVPQTHIDYPLLQGSDNNRYLTHAADGSYSAAGAVFADAAGMDNANTVIYGHNMGRSSNVIFHDITNFSDKAWFDKVRHGYIITEDKVIRLDFFAYALTRSETMFYSSVPDMEFIENNALYYRQTQADENTRIFTLSTCAYDFKDARAVLVAVGETLNRN